MLKLDKKENKLEIHTIAINKGFAVVLIFEVNF